MPDQPKTEEDKVKDINSRLGALKAIRQPFEADIDMAIAYVNHGILKIKDDPKSSRGRRTGIEVYDDTAIRANNLRADGLHGYLFSPGWFKLKLPNTIEFPRYSAARGMNGKRLDEIPEVAEWLTNAQEAMYSAYTASNWYLQTPEIFRMAGAMGSVPIYVERDLNQDRVCFTAVHLRECYLSRDRYGKVDGVWRVYNLRLKDMADKFGLDTMVEKDPAFKTQWETTPCAEREVTHAVYYRTKYDQSKLNAENKKVGSCWVWNNKLLLESGYDYFPWIVHDERRNANEWYSRSPGFDALVAILLANQMGRTNLIAGQTAAEPPYAVMEDLRGKFFTGPNARTYVDSMEQRPMAMQDALHGLPFMTEMLQRVEQAVREYFDSDLFMLMNRVAFENKNLTATQVVEMSGEKAAVMSPKTERIEKGTFDPSVDIMFAFEAEAGRIPPPPDIVFEMGVKKIDTDYYGPLSQARQRFYKAQGFRAGLSDMAELAQVAPQVLDIPDWDKIARATVREAFPADFMRTEDEVKAARQQRLQAQQAQEMMAAGMEAAKSMPGLSKAAEPGSPMAMLSGGGM